MQTFIHEIAKFSVDPRVGRDPIFLTKPTINVLRLGAKAFRNDVGWKLLAKMRHCLRSMPSTVRGGLQHQLTSGDYSQAFDTDRMFQETIAVFSKWRSWEIGDISTCRLFTHPFHQKEYDRNRQSPMKMMDIVDFLKQSVNLADVKLGVFDFLIYEEEPEQEDNRITIEDVAINIDMEYKLHDARVPENMTATTETERIGNSDALGFLDAIGNVHIHSISIASNPTLLAFARHMLTVQRVFTTKLKTLSHAIKASSAADRVDTTPEQPFDIMDISQRIDILAQSLINVDIISVTANSQRLTLCIDIEDSYGSLLFSNPKLSPVPSLFSSDRATSDTPSGPRSSNKAKQKGSAQRLVLSASGGIQGISLRFMELVHVASSISRNDLLRIELDGVNVNASDKPGN